MTRIHFLIDRSRIVDYFATPVRVARRRLKARGYDVRFYTHASPRALSCDILGLVSKATLKLVEEPNEVIGGGSPTLELLEKARRHADKVIWFDSSDSTSVTHFELLPYVDSYLKKHLLKDRELYREPFYGGRIFSDYYHREFGVQDTDPFTQFHPLPRDEEHKVHLSWNMGLGDLAHAFSRRAKVRRVLPGLVPPRFSAPFAPVHNDRDLDVFLRASANWHRESVVFHRQELVRQLQRIIEAHGLTGSASGRSEDNIPQPEYRERLRNTRIAFGPFGWGELNVREYEALIFGALLLRPDSSHMETWPEIFLDRQTCVFYRWDFEDLEDKILYYLEHDEERQRIAAAGQAAYRDVLSEDGTARFTDWFIQQVER